MEQVICKAICKCGNKHTFKHDWLPQARTLHCPKCIGTSAFYGKDIKDKPFRHQNG